MLDKKHILIVDDVEDNIQLAMNILKEDGYQFSFATNGEQALSLVQQSPGKFDLILLDIMMPGIDGYEVCKIIKSKPNSGEIPIIFLTAKTDLDALNKGFALGAVDYITKPFHADELLARVRTHVKLYAAQQLLEYHNIVLEYKVERVHKRLLSELEQTQKEMIELLTELVEVNSDETGKHIRRVSEISSLLAQLHPTLTDEDADTLMHASPMHDIGKITIAHEVLHKPGRYTEEEFCAMKEHTTNGYNLLRHSKRRIMIAAAVIAHEHHEKWNGKGYPRQLSGSDIHIYGRIVALADVLDALTHERCYKKAWDVDEAIAYIVDRRASQFDPELVDLMMAHIDQFKAIIEIR